VDFELSQKVLANYSPSPLPPPWWLLLLLLLLLQPLLSAATINQN
jgi:hypothetical protein